jgi:hypothetical protein
MRVEIKRTVELSGSSVEVEEDSDVGSTVTVFCTVSVTLDMIAVGCA